jgi:hypothetical protein
LNCTNPIIDNFLRNQFIRFFLKFAAQQSAIASAAAASANATYQAIKCHEMMKKDGHDSSGTCFPLSQFFKSTSS